MATCGADAIAEADVAGEFVEGGAPRGTSEGTTNAGAADAFEVVEVLVAERDAAGVAVLGEVVEVVAGAVAESAAVVAADGEVWLVWVVSAAGF